MPTLNLSLEMWHLVALVLMGFGMWQCMRGLRSLQSILLGWSFLIGFTLSAVLSPSLSDEMINQVVILGFFIGAFAAVVILWLSNKVGWIIGVLFSLYCGYLIYSFLIDFNGSETIGITALPPKPSSDELGAIIFAVILSVSLAVGLFLLEPTIVFCTAVVGAWIWVTAIAKLASGDSNLLQSLINPVAVIQEYGLLLILGWIVAGMFGLVWQYRGISGHKRTAQV